MSVQKKYDRLVKQWGREIANEIWAKRGAAIPFQKKGRVVSQSRSSPLVPGSFGSGKRR